MELLGSACMKALALLGAFGVCMHESFGFAWRFWGLHAWKGLCLLGGFGALAGAFATALRLCNHRALLQPRCSFAHAGRFCTFAGIKPSCFCFQLCKTPLLPHLQPHLLFLQAPCAPSTSTTSSAASPALPAAPTRRKTTVATLPPLAPKAAFATPASCKAVEAASPFLSAAVCTPAVICNGVRSFTPANVAASAAFAKGTARCNASRPAAVQTKSAWCRMESGVATLMAADVVSFWVPPHSGRLMELCCILLGLAPIRWLQLKRRKACSRSSWSGCRRR